MIVIGLDVSLTGTGYSRFENGKHISTGVIGSKKYDTTDLQRQHFILQTVEQKVLIPYYPITPERKVSVFIEDYAWGAKGGKLYSRAELIGMIKHRLYDMYGYDVYVINVSSLKKFICGDRKGKGKAKKDDMAIGVFNNYGWRCPIPSNMGADNAVDAYALAQYGLSYLSGNRLDIIKLSRR